MSKKSGCNNEAFHIPPIVTNFCLQESQDDREIAVEGRRASRNASTALSQRRKMILASSLVTKERAVVARAHTNNTPHFLENPSVITAAEYLSHIVHEGDSRCPKDVSWNPAKQ